MVRRSRHRGFTLLEVLIAIAILALLSLLGYRALSALSESESRLAAEANRWRELDMFFARLEGDLRQAMPRSIRIGDAQEQAWVGRFADANGNSELDFSRAGPEFAFEPGSAGQRLAYRYRDGTIEVLYWPGYDRPRAAEPAAYTLLAGISRFRLSYLAANGAWVDFWPLTGDTALPRALHVELTLASGEFIERWLALR
jgi:general secretion pathway protein J